MTKGEKVPPAQMFCNLLNISACSFTEVNKQVSNIHFVSTSYVNVIFISGYPNIDFFIYKNKVMSLTYINKINAAIHVLARCGAI